MRFVRGSGPLPELPSTSLSLARGGLALFFLVAGVRHLLVPESYRAIVPPWLPAPGLLVAISGWAEIAGGAGLLFPLTRRAAGWGLLFLLVLVFPANVEMLLQYRSRGVVWWGEALLWLRLPLQVVLMWGVWRVMGRRRV